MKKLKNRSAQHCQSFYDLHVLFIIFYFYYRAGHLRYFLILSIIKMIFFAFLNNLIRLGVDFINRNSAEVGYRVMVLKK